VPAGSSGAAACGAGGVMAWERGAGKGREGAEGVDVDYARVDIGGTFTDLVALDESTGAVVNAKALSTPRALIEGVLHCVDQTGVRLETCRLVLHGTTIGINVLLEGKGAKTSLVTTEGFRDVLEIGRGKFVRMYDVLSRRCGRLLGGQCLSLADYVTVTGTRDGATPAGAPLMLPSL